MPVRGQWDESVWTIFGDGCPNPKNFEKSPPRIGDVCRWGLHPRHVDTSCNILQLWILSKLGGDPQEPIFSCTSGLGWVMRFSCNEPTAVSDRTTSTTRVEIVKKYKCYQMFKGCQRQFSDKPPSCMTRSRPVWDSGLLHALSCSEVTLPICSNILKNGWSSAVHHVIVAWRCRKENLARVDIMPGRVSFLFLLLWFCRHRCDRLASHSSSLWCVFSDGHSLSSLHLGMCHAVSRSPHVRCFQVPNL